MLENGKESNFIMKIQLVADAPKTPIELSTNW
jgi:hypothetical protein